jgi:hypothetical protein
MAVPGPGPSSAIAIPYVEIINCCDSSDRGLFNIAGFDPLTFDEGVYNYTGPGFSSPQITFVTGNCYRITNPGNSGTPYFSISGIQWADFNIFSTDVENGCLECIDCDPDPLTKLVFTSCCNTSVVETQGQLPFGITQWLINYTGSLVNGFDNKCYVVTQVDNVTPEEHAVLPVAPVTGTYILVSDDPKAECSDYSAPECPTCSDPQCYTIINCDGLYYNTWEDLSAYVGEFITLNDRPGTWYVTLTSGSCNNAILSLDVEGQALEPCPCLCYEITGTLKKLQYVNCDNEVVKDATTTKFCSRVYPIFSGTPGQFQIIQGEECVDGLCPAVCYKLTNCDTREVIYSTLQTLSQYVNTSSVVTLVGYEGCWEIEESLAADCNCITVTIEDRSGITEYTATNIGTYNGWGVWKFTVDGDDFFISNQSINPVSSWIISITDCCANPGTTYAESKLESDCPETISDGSLTGWVIQEGSPWINIQTEKCPGPCECPADITVVQEFSSCETCEPYVAYKLQNCEKIYDVQYTTQDLSEYLGSVIETDCGCFTVQQINFVPPSTTLVVIDNTFKTCNNCLSTFYRLTDCAGEVGDIVTTTDLSDYVGSVIKIENCDTCWEIETTRTFETLSNVVVAEQFESCIECGIDLPCVCSKLTNLTLIEQTVEYVDCENQTQEITLLAGETSEKICLKKWILPVLPEGQFLYAEYFGNCLQLDTTAFICPQPVFKNNRTVRPGYNTPACTPEKYDQITCKFADMMYKVVLEKRYGITNCCPEEDDRWLVQKELIDLQALKDPNYNCPSCPCPCNSGKSYSTCNCKN